MFPSLSVEEVAARLDDPAYLVVDISRPARWNVGTLPGATGPRGMLEFWVDPRVPTTSRRSMTADPSCSTAGAPGARPWPATLHDMGHTDVTHLAGGFSAGAAARSAGDTARAQA